MIVTDGLVGYWNSKQGVEGNTWKNLAPDTRGQFDAEIHGATLTPEGMYFDGIDDSVKLNIPDSLISNTSFTIELVMDIDTSHNDESYSYYHYVVSAPKDWNSELIYVYKSRGESAKLGFMAWDEDYTTTVDTTHNYPGGRIRLTISYDVERQVLDYYINGVLEVHPFWGHTNKSIFYHNWLLLGAGYSIDYPENGKNNFAKGIIDNVRIYDRALTPEEVHQNYAVGMEIGLKTPVEIAARFKTNGDLNIPGDLKEGNDLVSFDVYGDLKVDEIIEGESLGFKDGKIYVNEFIEGDDLDGTT